MNSRYSFKARVGIAALLAITIHVVIAGSVLISPALGRSTTVGAFYRKFVLLGPYFGERTISSSYHLNISYFNAGKWSAFRNFGQEAFAVYCVQPWRYDKLHIKDYARYAAWQSYQENADPEKLDNSRHFQALVRFVSREWIGEPVDSVRLIFCKRSYKAITNTYAVDTLFSRICHVESAEDANAEH